MLVLNLDMLLILVVWLSYNYGSQGIVWVYYGVRWVLRDCFECRMVGKVQVYTVSSSKMVEL